MQIFHMIPAYEYFGITRVLPKTPRLLSSFRTTKFWKPRKEYPYLDLRAKDPYLYTVCGLIAARVTCLGLGELYRSRMCKNCSRIHYAVATETPLFR